MIVNVGHIFSGGHFGITDKEKVFVAQQIDQMVPLLYIGLHIGGVAAVGLLKQGKGTVGTH
jgi:hypothetical protein